MGYIPAGEVTTPLYTSSSSTPLAIIASRHASRNRRFFGGAFTDAGQILTKETDDWTEVAFWYNAQKANPAVVYAITYDGANVYEGPFTRATPTPPPPPSPGVPPPTKPSTPGAPWAPVLASGATKPPSKMSPWLLIGGGAAILLLFVLARRPS